MKSIKGRHWVFIVGILLAVVTSKWSEDIAVTILGLLAFMGFGIFLRDTFKFI